MTAQRTDAGAPRSFQPAFKARYNQDMAVYEFFCPTCRVQFEERRPMADSHLPATCKDGHDADRLVSAFAVTTTTGTAVLDESAPLGGGSCCAGGGCACAAT